ncbi:MAG TPA: hypothetical protein VND80_01595 [Steroidobacteraceae bacterium]|nr:hypothetical protein [Steroidobacteraceae bacterium]
MAAFGVICGCDPFLLKIHERFFDVVAQIGGTNERSSAWETLAYPFQCSKCAGRLCATARRGTISPSRPGGAEE